MGILKTKYMEWSSSMSLGGRSPTHPGSAIPQLQNWHWGSLNLATLKLHLLENEEEPPSGLCKAMIYVKSLWKQHCNHLAMSHYYWWPINCQEKTLIYNSLKSENSQKEINEEYRFKNQRWRDLQHRQTFMSLSSCMWLWYIKHPRNEIKSI